MVRSSTRAADVAVRDEEVPGPRGPVAVRRYAPLPPPVPPPVLPAPGAPTLVWLHGGGFVAGGLDGPESDAVGRALAAAGVEVVPVAYPLAPLLLGGRSPGAARQRHPAPLLDVLAVLAHVRATATGPVLLGGASAGACLAAGAVLAGVAGGPGVDGAVLAHGTFHALLPRRPRALRARLRGRRRSTHTRWPLAAVDLDHAGSLAALRDPTAFPGGHPLPGFPPTLLLDADRDGLRASSDALARDLAAAGVEVEQHVVAGAFHSFLGRPDGPAFAVGVDVVARWALALRADGA